MVVRIHQGQFQAAGRDAVSLGSIAPLTHDLFFPTLGLAVIISLAWRRIPPGRLRTSLQISATLLFFAPLVAVGLLRGQSIQLVLYQEALGAVFFLAIAVLGGRRLYLERRGGRPATQQSPSLPPRNAVGIGLAAAAMGVWGTVLAEQFVGDVFGKRIVVEGPVGNIWIERGPRGIAVDRYVLVNGKRYSVTADVLGRLRPGTWIHGQAGAGSHTLLWVEP
jgi:hypothetical protein